MTFGRLNIPASLLTAQEEGKLVIFAGAGVSIGPPSDLPGFVALTRAIAQRELTEFEKAHLDQLLGQLKHEGRDVHTLAVRELSRPGSAPTHLHGQLVGLFRRKEEVRIVTTNFDPHFVTAVARHENLPIYRAPALPRGGDFHGLVHLHGALNGPERDLVLTDEDFGRAYLTEGWARTFLEQLFRNYVVLFVGYSHTDPPMHYLARGLPIESPPRRFVITPEQPERWQRLGIGVIPYVKEETDDPHRPLTYGVTQWVNVTRGSQFGLDDQITQLLARPDPTTLNDEEASLIEWSVTHETSVASFVRNARGLVWVDWLDSRGLLTRFFDPSARFPNWHDRQIASWLADRLLEGPPGKAYEIVRRQGGRFCRELHRWLANQLGDRTLPIAWTFLVLQQTERDDQNSQYVIGTKLRDLVRNDLNSFWPLFRVLTDPQLETEPVGFGGSGEPGACRVVIVGDASVLWSVWREAIAPLAAEIGPSLLALLMEQLARATQLAQACSDEHFHLRATGGRSRIARVDHHYHRESRLDVLVDILVELIATLARTRALPEANITQWLAGEDTIVRRLGLHALGESADLGREMKLERARAAAGLYSADTPEKREADALVRRLEQPIPEAVPGSIGEPALPPIPESLPPIADLLQLSPDRLRRAVLTARLAPDTVIASVRELVTASATNAGLESHALWDLLLGRLNWRRLDLAERTELMQLAEQPFLLRNHADVLVRVFFSDDPVDTQTKRERPAANDTERRELFRLSERLWPAVRDQEETGAPDFRETDWVNRALNDSIGTYFLVRFWLQYLSSQPHEAAAPTLPATMVPIFTDIATRATPVARRARAVILQELRFLMARDPEWTVANLVPWFDFVAKGDEAWIAWRSFLEHGHLSRLVALALLPRIRADQARLLAAGEMLVGHLLQHIATIVVNVRPTETAAWMRELLGQLNESERLRWARLVGRELERMPDSDQRDLWDSWLGAYWSDRRAGRLGQRTIPLTGREAAIMVGWLPGMTEKFPEAVGLVRASPTPDFREEIFPWRLLKQSTLPTRHPAVLVELLGYLLEHMDSARVSHEMLRETVERLPREFAFRVPLLRIAEKCQEHGWVPARDFRQWIETEYPAGDR